MAKKKKGLLDKVLHPDTAGEHELEGEGDPQVEAPDFLPPVMDEERDQDEESDAGEHELEGDKHQHKKFDKFKRGN